MGREAQIINISRTTLGCLRPTQIYLNFLQRKSGHVRDFILHEGLTLFEEAYKNNPQYYDEKHERFITARMVGMNALSEVIKII